MNAKEKSEVFSESFLENLCEHDRIFIEKVEDMIKTKLDGTKRYGFECWCSLGSKGLFADINRKYYRLKNDVWNEKRKLTSESLQDTCRDFAVYTLFMLMALEKEGRIKSWRTSAKN